MSAMDKDLSATIQKVGVWVSSCHLQSSLSSESSSPLRPRSSTVMDTTPMATSSKVNQLPPIKPGLIAPHNSLNSEYSTDEISPMELPSALGSSNRNPSSQNVDVKTEVTCVSSSRLFEESRPTIPGPIKPNFSVCNTCGLRDFNRRLVIQKKKSVLATKMAKKPSETSRVSSVSPVHSDISLSMSSGHLEELAEDVSSVSTLSTVILSSDGTLDSEPCGSLAKMFENPVDENESNLVGANPPKPVSQLLVLPFPPSRSPFTRAELRSAACPEAVVPSSILVESDNRDSTSDESNSQGYYSNDDEWDPMNMRCHDQKTSSTTRSVETGNISDDNFSPSLPSASVRPKSIVSESVYDLPLSSPSNSDIKPSWLTMKQMLNSTEATLNEVNSFFIKARKTIDRIIIDNHQCCNEIQNRSEDEFAESAAEMANDKEVNELNIGSSICRLPDSNQTDKQQQYASFRSEETPSVQPKNSNANRNVNTSLIEGLKGKIHVVDVEIVRLIELKHENEKEIREHTEKIHALGKTKWAIESRLQGARTEADLHIDEIMRIKALNKAAIGNALHVPMGSRHPYEARTMISALFLILWILYLLGCSD